jgi:hypothetical protein
MKEKKIYKTNIELSKIELKEIDGKLANKIICDNHYSGTVAQGVQFHIGIFYENILYGVAQFGYGIRPKDTCKWVKDTTPNEYLELNRLWISDILGMNSESKAISLCLKYVKQRKVIFIKRPTNLAYSGTSSENSAMHSIKRYEKEFSKIDYIILFQVTSPFRKNSTIKKIINLSKKYPNDQIVTVSDRIVKKPNGVMYLTPKDTLFKKKNFSYKNFRPYLIKSKKESLDIDTYDDFKIAKKMIKA